MPLGVLLGIEIVTDVPGRCVCRLRIEDHHLNQAFITHGGALFSLADTALGLVANRPDDEFLWAGTSFAMQLYRSLAIGEIVEATATIEHGGRSLRACRVDMVRIDDSQMVGTLINELVPVRPQLQATDDDQIQVRHVPADGILAIALNAVASRSISARTGDVPEKVGLTDTVVLAVYVDEQPVGMAGISSTDSVSVLSKVWIRPLQSRDLILDRLVKSAFQEAASRGTAQLLLSASLQSEVELAFERNGYLIAPSPDDRAPTMIRANI